MEKKLVLGIAVAAALAGCSVPQPQQQSNPRVVQRDLAGGSTDLSKNRILTSNLKAPVLPVAPAATAAVTVPIQPVTQGVPTQKTAQKQMKFRFEQTDLSFKQALFRWGKQAGYQIEYEAEKDFPGRISSDIADDFETALKLATAAYRKSDYPLKACAYENRVVRIVRYQASGKECN